jgi:hypothetical protein
LLRLDALFSSLILENNVDSLDDFLARIGFAIDYNLVLQRFGTANLHYVFLGKTIVPAAIPSGQIIRIFLKRVRQLSASQLLNIQITIGVSYVLSSTCAKACPAMTIAVQHRISFFAIIRFFSLGIGASYLIAPCPLTVERSCDVDAGLLFPPRAAQGSSPAVPTLERKQGRAILYMQQENRLLCNFGTSIAVERSTKYRLVEGQSNQLPALAAKLVRYQVTVVTASDGDVTASAAKEDGRAAWHRSSPFSLYPMMKFGRTFVRSVRNHLC